MGMPVYFLSVWSRFQIQIWSMEGRQTTTNQIIIVEGTVSSGPELQHIPLSTVSAHALFEQTVSSTYSPRAAFLQPISSPKASLPTVYSSASVPNISESDVAHHPQVRHRQSSPFSSYLDRTVKTHATATSSRYQSPQRKESATEFSLTLPQINELIETAVASAGDAIVTKLDASIKSTVEKALQAQSLTLNRTIFQ